MEQITFERPQLIGFAGVALLIFGCFAPLVYLPIVGSISYFQGDGKFVILFAIAAAVLIYLKRYNFSLIATGLAAALCLYTFFSLESRLSDMRGELNGNPFADAAAAAVGLAWGWALLLFGIAALVYAALTGRGTAGAK